MELNREQAINILDRFDFFQGQRAGRELWNDKPFDVQEVDLKKFSKDVASLKSFIKELTQANEMLSESYDHLEKTKDELLEERSKLTEENARLTSKLVERSAVNAKFGGEYKGLRENNLVYCYNLGFIDGVREMQTRFATCFGTYTDKDMTPITEVFIRLDLIAKEILEGNENGKS